MNQSTPSSHFLGLRTVIYPAPELDQVKSWYTSILGLEPYFDQPFYVGYNIGGYELGLDPDAPRGAAGAVTYWGVPNAQEALAHIRQRLRQWFGAPAADECHVIYGGSVKPDNTRDLIAQPDVDGALVGGASLDLKSFFEIVSRART